MLSKEEIINIIKKHPNTIMQYFKKYHNDDYNFINNIIGNFNTNKFSEKVYQYIYGDRPICKECENFTTFSSINKGYLKFCSQSCQQKNTARKYGVTNLFKSEVIKKKMKETCLKKYGNESAIKTDIVKKKGKQTKLEKYGNENYNNFKKFKKTCLEKYGVDNPNKLKSVRDKVELTNLNRYGVKYFTNPEKTKETCLKKYGVEFVMHDKTCFMNQEKSSCKYKKYKWPSGKETNYQGYENLAIDILLKKYDEDDIINVRSNIPSFWYNIDNKKKRYYPDILVKSTNTIYEIKSTWTYEKGKENIEKKIQSVISNGYNFRLLILNSKGKILNEI